MRSEDTLSIWMCVCFFFLNPPLLWILWLWKIEFRVHHLSFVCRDWFYTAFHKQIRKQRLQNGHCLMLCSFSPSECQTGRADVESPTIGRPRYFPTAFPISLPGKPPPFPSYKPLRENLAHVQSKDFPNQFTKALSWPFLCTGSAPFRESQALGQVCRSTALPRPVPPTSEKVLYF